MNMIVMIQYMITKKKGFVVRTRARTQQRDFNFFKVASVDHSLTSIYPS